MTNNGDKNNVTTNYINMKTINYCQNQSIRGLVDVVINVSNKTIKLWTALKAQWKKQKYL